MSTSAPSQRKNSASRPASKIDRSSIVGARSVTVPSERGTRDAPVMKGCPHRAILGSDRSRKAAILRRDGLAVWPEHGDLTLHFARGALHRGQRERRADYSDAARDEEGHPDTVRFAGYVVRSRRRRGSSDRRDHSEPDRAAELLGHIEQSRGNSLILLLHPGGHDQHDRHNDQALAE